MPTSTDVMGSATAAGALEYLDFLAAQRHVPAGAASAVRIAFVKILKAVDGDAWGKVDAREIDVQEHMRRFGDLNRGTYAQKSLNDYRSRLKKAMAWYLAFLADPEWVPTVKVRKVSARHRSGPSAEETAREMPAPVSPSERHGGHAESASFVRYPFPLSTGVLATLDPPPALSSEDARRMVRFVDALVAEGQ